MYDVWHERFLCVSSLVCLGGTLLTSFLGLWFCKHYCIPIYWKPVPGLKLELLNADGSSMFRQPRRYSMKIREQKYELSLQLHGKKRKLIFPLPLWHPCTVLCMFCSIFKPPLLISFPLECKIYKIYIVIFMAIVVPLSCTSIVD
jgi:hypothetical protein